MVLILSSLMVHRLAVVLQHTAAFYPPCPSVLTVMRDRREWRRFERLLLLQHPQQSLDLIALPALRMQVGVEMLDRLHQEPDLVFGEINFHEPILSAGVNV